MKEGGNLISRHSITIVVMWEEHDELNVSALMESLNTLVNRSSLPVRTKLAHQRSATQREVREAGMVNLPM